MKDPVCVHCGKPKSHVFHDVCAAATCSHCHDFCVEDNPGKEWRKQPQFKEWSGPFGLLIRYYYDDGPPYYLAIHRDGSCSTGYPTFADARYHLQAWLQNTTESKIKELKKRLDTML